MGKKSEKTTNKTVYGNTTTTNPYVTSQTTNKGTVSAFNPGTAYDTINNFVNANTEKLLDEYLNPTLNSVTNQSKMNSFMNNLNAQTSQNLENNIINPLSNRNMVRSSQATNMYNNLAQTNASQIAEYANNLLAKLNSYLIAEENIAMGWDMVTTVTGSLDKIAERVTRLREISMQISNGTYDENSVNALSLEASAIIKEIERLRSETEYNGVNLFSGNEPPSMETVTKTVGLSTTSSGTVLVPYEVYIKTTDELGDVVTFDTDKEVRMYITGLVLMFVFSLNFRGNKR